jgi:predicted nuclease of predicted toxin-antitoxin system
VKIKLDENIGRRGQELLRAAGHDVATVYDQGKGGASDEELFRLCAREERALITLDHHFRHVLRFPPERAAEIVVLELPSRATPEAMLNRLREFLQLLASRPLKSELWIVEPGRVRVHQRKDD